MKNHAKEGYHIAAIMDGNGRWASAQGLPRLQGHTAGVATVKTLLRELRDAPVHTFTLFAFAIANWKRDKEEVEGIWQLLQHFLEHDTQELMDAQIRIRVIGDKSGIPGQVRKTIEAVEKRSQENEGLLLQIALNYDGVDEVARLLKRTLHAGVDPNRIDTEYVRTHLDTEACNEPDIVIRTGMKERKGKFSYWRSSAFLPLQSAQSVCVGSTTLWPDFSIKELQEIIDFADPDSRLFGGQRM